MTDVIIYGIPNCDTMKKAFTWLKDHNVDFKFHDYKKEGISAVKLKAWSKLAGWETIFNKKSSTWKIVAAANPEVTSQAAAIKIMQEHNSIIRRPVIETNGTILVGFDEQKYAAAFSK